MTDWIHRLIRSFRGGPEADKTTVAGRGAHQRADGAKNHRSFQRLDVSLPVTLVVEEREVCGIATSLSSGGVFVSCDETISEGSSVTIRLCPDERKGDIVAEAHVAYANHAGLGVRFVGLTLSDMHRLNGVLQAASETYPPRL